MKGSSGFFLTFHIITQLTFTRDINPLTIPTRKGRQRVQCEWEGFNEALRFMNNPISDITDGVPHVQYGNQSGGRC